MKKKLKLSDCRSWEKIKELHGGVYWRPFVSELVEEFRPRFHKRQGKFCLSVRFLGLGFFLGLCYPRFVLNSNCELTRGPYRCLVPSGRSDGRGESGGGVGCAAVVLALRFNRLVYSFWVQYMVDVYWLFTVYGWLCPFFIVFKLKSLDCCLDLPDW